MARNKGNGRGAGPAGLCLRAGGKDGPQVVASNGKRWTEAAEARFLDALGASCNVTLAARAAGFSTAAIYKRRRLDPAFAARWQAALAQGYARIEMALVARAGDALEGVAPDPDAPFPAMSVADAINVLKLHKAAATGESARSPGWRGRPRGLDEMRDSILVKFEAVERHRRASAQAAPAPDEPAPDESASANGEIGEAEASHEPA